MKPALLTVLLLALLPGAAGAQLDTPTSPLPVFQLAERHDWLLRVTLEDGGVVEGRVREITDDAVRLEDGAFAVANVDGVARRVRDRGGALEGALVGGLALGSLGWWLFVDDGSETDDDWTPYLAAAGGAAIGAIVGAVIGARVDPSTSEWLPVWPADQ